MTLLELPYGQGALPFHAPSERLEAVLRPSPLPASGADPAGIVRQALDHPLFSPTLRELARGKKRVTLITSDHTRPMPSAVTLPVMLEEIRRGNPDASITVLVGTGMHRPTTREEMEAKFGRALTAKENIVFHRAQCEDDLVCLGRLPSGGELWINRLVAQSDLGVSEGFIEPHFFAGFSGGRKSILPGVAGWKTVLYNHNAGFIADERARQGILEGNPIHRDMQYAAQAAGLRFILNVLLDADKRIAAAVAGDPQAAHEEGCRLCLAHSRVPAVTADVVFTPNGGYPLDQNLYQTVKSMTAAEACVRPGGVIVVCAELREGHGGQAFYDWLAQRGSAAETERDILSIPPQSTRMDQWQAQILARVMQKAVCVGVTDESRRALVEGMRLRWAPNPDAALRLADNLVGQDARLCVIPDGVGVIVTP